MTALYLASRSPRRRELLAQMGLTPTVIDVEVDESGRPGESASRYVERLARAKADAGWHRLGVDRRPDAVVLGADTAVTVEGKILGKPVDASDAEAMLRRLSGRTHRVLTGVAVCCRDELLTAVSDTEVVFDVLTSDQIERYCATGEPLDKAGGYGIQGQGGVFVAHLAGSYSGVVGLPLFETARLLRQAGVIG